MDIVKNTEIPCDIYRYLANKNGTVEFGLHITLQFILDSSKASYGGDVGNHAQWI